MISPERTRTSSPAESLPPGRDQGVPEPVAIFVYLNGDGQEVKEKMSLSQVEERQLELHGKEEKLRQELAEISSRRAEFSSKKRKAHGRRRPIRERRQILEPLKKREEVFREDLASILKTRDRLKKKVSLMIRSDPRDPLVIRFEEGRDPEIVSGKELSDVEEVEWRQFLIISGFQSALRDPEIAGVRKFFGLRWELNQAKIKGEGEDRVEEEIANFIAKHDLRPNRYDQLRAAISSHFEKELSQKLRGVRHP